MKKVLCTYVRGLRRASEVGADDLNLSVIPSPPSAQVMRPKCLKFLQGSGDDVAEPHLLLHRKINTPERSDLNEMRLSFTGSDEVRWWSFQSHIMSHLLKYQLLRGKEGVSNLTGSLVCPE